MLSKLKNKKPHELIGFFQKMWSNNSTCFHDDPKMPPMKYTQPHILINWGRHMNVQCGNVARQQHDVLDVEIFS